MWLQKEEKTKYVVPWKELLMNVHGDGLQPIRDSFEIQVRIWMRSTGGNIEILGSPVLRNHSRKQLRSLNKSRIMRKRSHRRSGKTSLLVQVWGVLLTAKNTYFSIWPTVATYSWTFPTMLQNSQKKKTLKERRMSIRLLETQYMEEIMKGIAHNW